MSDSTISPLNHTIPQRLTVAGVAYLSVSTSNMIRTDGGRLSRSPLGRVSILLSSKTLIGLVINEIDVPVEILHPDRVNITIKNNPVSFLAFSPNIVDDSSKHLCKQAVRPFACRRI